MAYEQRDNDGVIFTNDRKRNDRQPDWTGKAMVGGAMYYVSGWTKNGNKGEFFTLAFKPMDDQQAPRDDGDQRRQPARQQQRGGYDQGPRRQPMQSRGPSSRPGPFGGDPVSMPDKDSDDIPFRAVLPRRWV